MGLPDPSRDQVAPFFSNLLHPLRSSWLKLGRPLLLVPLPSLLPKFFFLFKRLVAIHSFLFFRSSSGIAEGSRRSFIVFISKSPLFFLTPLRNTSISCPHVAGPISKDTVVVFCRLIEAPCSRRLYFDLSSRRGSSLLVLSSMS